MIKKLIATIGLLAVGLSLATAQDDAKKEGEKAACKYVVSMTGVT